MTTQRLLLTTRGKAAHAGLAPEEGISAILEMAYVLQAALLLDSENHRVTVETVRGGMRPNIIAPQCQAWIRVDAVNNGEIDAFRAALHALPASVPGASLVVASVDAAAGRDIAGDQAGTTTVNAAPWSLPPALRRRYVAVPPLPTRVGALHTQPAADEISAHLAGQQAEMLACLTELARLETPSSQPKTQRAAFDLLAHELAVAGYDSTWWPGRRNGGLLLAQPRTRRRGAPLQLLLGHCDTVWPVGTLASMPLLVRDGRLSGPGVFDMKAGLVQAIYALRALSALGLRSPATPVLLVNSDEEIGSGESTRTIERLARIACRAFVLEPALGPDGKLKTARKGVGQFRITLAATQAAPNAVATELARLIRALFDLNDLPSGVTVNVGVVAGEGAGQLNNAEMVVDVRVPDAGSTRRVEAAVAALRSAIPSVSLETTGRVSRLPLERTARNQTLWRTAQRLGSELGLALDEGAAGGGSDGNTTSQYTATLDGLGAVGDGAHALHEHVVIADMPRRAALLALLLLSPVAPP